MKIACDICEKVENGDRTNDWLSIVVNGHSRFLFCKECEKKFWNLFKKDKKEVWNDRERSNGNYNASSI